jgi:four helix bundle protein
MSEKTFAVHFTDLIVYQKSRQLGKEIYLLSANFPKEEMYSLTDQIRRASRSVGAQIAEAWAKRRYERHFVSKLTDADGELKETMHWIDVARDCGYITHSSAKNLFEQCLEIARILGWMIENPMTFCRPSTQKIREENSE